MELDRENHVVPQVFINEDIDFFGGNKIMASPDGLPGVDVPMPNGGYCYVFPENCKNSTSEVSTATKPSEPPKSETARTAAKFQHVVSLAQQRVPRNIDEAQQKVETLTSATRWAQANKAICVAQDLGRVITPGLTPTFCVNEGLAVDGLKRELATAENQLQQFQK